MDWKEYVGEYFQGPDSMLYQAEAYDPKHGFRLSELNNAHRKVQVSTSEIGKNYQYVFGPQTMSMIKSIKNTKDGHSLIDRACLNLRLGMPINEMIIVFRQEGYSCYDIYLTIKGAEILLKK